MSNLDSNKLNFYKSFHDSDKWSKRNRQDTMYEMHTLMEFLKRILFKLIVCIENFNYLFKDQVNARDESLNKVVANVEKLYNSE